MEKSLYQTYLDLLREELVVAMGCTEPIAIAYAAAKARQVLGEMPERCTVKCSGNMIKNVQGVTVPTSEGMRGIEIAAALGIVGGDADRELAVLQTVTHEDLEKSRMLLEKKFCRCELVEGVENLYIAVEVNRNSDSALIEIRDHHTNITKICRNGKTLLENEADAKWERGEDKRTLLNVRDIIAFADCLETEDAADILNPQLNYNTAISEEGLAHDWGACVGKTILETEGTRSVQSRAAARAAAGSDARMGGCTIPVVINSGSGNQGITITMPIVEYAQELGVSEEMKLRALALGNLIAIHQKKYIGSLSAYCGAVSAACAAACGVGYMMYRDQISDEEMYRLICDTITNTICTAGGIVCDGAKSSCAAKIATSVKTALTGLQMSIKHRVFQPGEGLTMKDTEKTIAAVGRMAREGMRSTDVEILHIMLGQ